jgi:hypothetical protein
VTGPEPQRERTAAPEAKPLDPAVEKAAQRVARLERDLEALRRELSELATSMATRRAHAV